MGHPNRLPIPVALDERPRTLGELVDLGLPLDPVKHALKQLSAAGLVEVVDHQPTKKSIVALVYGTPLKGWSQIRDAIASVAATADR